MANNTGAQVPAAVQPNAFTILLSKGHAHDWTLSQAVAALRNTEARGVVIQAAPNVRGDVNAAELQAYENEEEEDDIDLEEEARLLAIIEEISKLDKDQTLDRYSLERERVVIYETKIVELKAEITNLNAYLSRHKNYAAAAEAHLKTMMKPEGKKEKRLTVKGLSDKFEKAEGRFVFSGKCEALISHNGVKCNAPVVPGFHNCQKHINKRAAELFANGPNKEARKQ